jgi:hypothetical protein
MRFLLHCVELLQLYQTIYLILYLFYVWIFIYTKATESVCDIDVPSLT